MFIYLASPKPKDAEEWAVRAHLTDRIKRMGWSVFDPWGAWAGGAQPGPAVAIVNLTAVAACDVLLAYCPDDITATGTAIEIGYALAKEKKILIWQTGDESAMFCHPSFHYVVSMDDVENTLGVAS